MKLQQLESLSGKDHDDDSSSFKYSSVIHLTMDNEDESELWKDVELIDSVLLRAYIRTNRPAIIPFLRNENYCSFDDAQTLLAQAGMESELITLYSVYHKHDLVAPRASPHA